MNDLKLPSQLRADCARCAGLCCVVPAFYSIQGFAFDKAAHSPCRHLTRENRCGIHAARAARGFSGCVAFDCHGAGQRVTQELLNGIDWRALDAPALKVLSCAYACCLALHELMAMLALAEAMVAPQSRPALRRERNRLDELCRSEAVRNGTLEIATLRREIRALVLSVSSPFARLPVMRQTDRECP